MPAWAWFVLGVATSAMILIVVWALLFRGSSSFVDRVALAESDRKRLEDERDAERNAKEKAEFISTQLEAELREIAQRRRVKIEEIDDSTIKDFKRFVDDPDALLARIDEIVGRSTYPGTKPDAGG